MPQYRLKQKHGEHSVGIHYDHTAVLTQADAGDVTLHKQGEIIESDKPLDQLFPEKFELHHPTLTPVEAAAAVWPPVGFEDVTAAFATAGANGLVVLKRVTNNIAQYAVCRDGESPDTCLNKDKPLRKSEVTGFIDNYVEAQTAKAPAKKGK